MKQDRRDFIRKTTAGMLAGFSLTDFALKPEKFLPGGSKGFSADDEALWDLVRLQFPLSKDMIFLNNGTMGPSPYPVIEAVHRGMMDADRMTAYSGWEETIPHLATFCGATEKEIALTHNVTEGINIVCWGLPLKKGDEVIMTTHEHAGNALPWLNRQKQQGIIIRTFSPALTADEVLNQVNSLITKKTKAIAVPHILCSQGQVMPVKEICALGKQKGLFVFIDGAHGPGMVPLDLHDMGCDAYATCAHKWMLGPKGTGFLYVRKDFQDTLQPYFVYAGSDNARWNLTKEPFAIGDYADSAHRYYGGTQALGLARGVSASIDFINTIDLGVISKRIHMLGKYTQDRLLELGDKIEMLTPVEERSRCAITGFRIRNVAYDKFYSKALEEKIRIRMVPENGLNLLRVSTHIYNNKQEVDRLVELIKKAV